MKKTRRRVGSSLLGLIVATGLAASVLPTASAADYVDAKTIKSDNVTLETGHIDAFNLISTGKGKIRMVLKEDVTGSGVLREPESVTLKVKEKAKMTLPAAAKDSYADIINDGLTNDFYYLPLTQDQNLIWPGWDSMGAAPALGIGNLNDANCDNVIEKVQTPAGGKVLMWSINDWGQPDSVMSNGKYALPNTIVQPILAHQHINWAFTKAGTYKLTVHSKVTVAASKASLTSESHVFTFKVGDVPVADKTVLKGTIAAAEYMQESDYTKESWTPFAKALADAKKVQSDGSATQQAVDAAVSALNDAWDALEVSAPPVDWTALDAAIAKADKLKQSDYTAASWAPFAETLSNAKTIRQMSEAAQVDADDMVTWLTDAQKALVKVAPAPAKADKKALNDAIAATASLKQSDFTADSWTPFAKALADAKSVQADAKATQKTVDAAAAALTDAQKGLKKPAPVVDWSKLDVAIAAAASLKQSDYTAASWKPFTDALAAAKAVRANSKAAQAEVDAAASTLIGAQTKLVKVSANPQPTKADKTALNAAVDAAAKFNEADYTADSWKPFADALATAKSVQADDAATQAAVDAAASALSNAQNGLAKPAPVVDWAALDHAIAAADPLAQSAYTADSWKPFANALAGARSVRANADATQAEADAAAGALVDAQSRLVEAPAPKPTKADKTALNAAVDAAAKLKESTYTADSWKLFAAALAAAKTAQGDDNATQHVVDAAAKTLADVQKSLQNATPSPTPTPTNPSDGKKPAQPAPNAPTAPNKQTPANPNKQAPNKQTPTNPDAANNKLAATGSSIEPIAALLALFALAGIAFAVLRSKRRND